MLHESILLLYLHTQTLKQYTMNTTDKKIERIKQINDFILNQPLSKVEFEKYQNQLTKLKKEFSKYERNYYQLDLPLEAL